MGYLDNAGDRLGPRLQFKSGVQTVIAMTDPWGLPLAYNKVGFHRERSAAA
jgi:hypothetical protein